LNPARVGQPVAWQAPESQMDTVKGARLQSYSYSAVKAPGNNHLLGPHDASASRHNGHISVGFLQKDSLRDTVCIIVGIFYVLPPQSLTILTTCSCRTHVSHRHNYRLSRDLASITWYTGISRTLAVHQFRTLPTAPLSQPQ
jgi:hypothetical protein